MNNPDTLLSVWPKQKRKIRYRSDTEHTAPGHSVKRYFSAPGFTERGRGLKSSGYPEPNMVDAEWVETEVRKVYPDADIAATDLTGNGDHWFVKVIDPSFEGMRPLPRQRPILSHFKQFIQSNIVHALDLKCWTPEQAAQKEEDGLFHPHQQDDFVGLHVRRVRKEE